MVGALVVGAGGVVVGAGAVVVGAGAAVVGAGGACVGLFAINTKGYELELLQNIRKYFKSGWSKWTSSRGL